MNRAATLGFFATARRLCLGQANTLAWSAARPALEEPLDDFWDEDELATVSSSCKVILLWNKMGTTYLSTELAVRRLGSGIANERRILGAGCARRPVLRLQQVEANALPQLSVSVQGFLVVHVCSPQHVAVVLVLSQQPGELASRLFSAAFHWPRGVGQQPTLRSGGWPNENNAL